MSISNHVLRIVAAFLAFWGAGPARAGGEAPDYAKVFDLSFLPGWIAFSWLRRTDRL